MSDFLKIVNGEPRGTQVQFSDLGGTALVTQGGTGQTSLTQYSVLVGNGTSGITQITEGQIGQVLTGQGAANPAFESSVQLGSSALGLTGILALGGSTGGIVQILPQASFSNYNFNLPTSAGSSGQVLTSGGGGSSPMTWSSAGSGTVTSVALSDGSTTPIYSISGSPVTSSGTLTFSLETQSANTVFAGPGSGSAAQPTFRSLVSADIPNNSANTTGTAANITATSNSTLTSISSLTHIGTISNGIWNAAAIGAIYGGTNQTSWTTGDTLYASASNTLSKLAIGSTGNVLTVSGGVPTWAAPATSGTVTSVDMSVPSFLSISGNPITTSGTLTLSYSGTALPVSNGGTGVTSVTTSPTATVFAGWDANSNLSANNFIQGYATTTTAAGTTTLTVSSPYQQYFTGSSTQTVKLPVASTLVNGTQYLIVNNSSNIVTVESSGGNTLQAMAANTELLATLISTSGTNTSSWSWTYAPQTGGTVTSVALTVPTFLSVSGSPVTTSGTLAVTLSGTALPVANGGTGQTSGLTANGIVYASSSSAMATTSSGTSGQILTSNGSGSAPTMQTVPGNTAILKAPTVQKFTSGSGTYTTPTSPSPLYIRVRMVGGGGGGGGSSTIAGNNGGAGNVATAATASTFGTTLLSAGPGSGGGGTGAGGGGAGGSSSLGSGPTGIALTGAPGGAGNQSSTSGVFIQGGQAGVSALGGAGGQSGPNEASGVAANANTGSGGSGATLNAATEQSGGGGGSGGYVDAIITSLASSYSYSVGVGGSGGAAGTGGNAGGAGGSGLIIVEEYYQ